VVAVRRLATACHSVRVARRRRASGVATGAQSGRAAARLGLLRHMAGWCEYPGSPREERQSVQSVTLAAARTTPAARCAGHQAACASSVKKKSHSPSHSSLFAVVVAKVYASLTEPCEGMLKRQAISDW